MIEWWALFHNALWVVGLAVGLAALGLAHFEANRAEVRLRTKLGEPGFQLALDAGMVLFCLGLLFSSRAWWEYVIWGVLAAAFAGQALWLWRQSRIASRASGGAPSSPAPPTRVRSHRLTWLGRGLVLGGLLVLVAWSILTGQQLLDHGLSLRSHLNDLESLAQGGAGELALSDLDGIGQHLAGMNQDLAAIQTQAGPLLPFTRLLRWVPEHGGDLAAAPDLLQVAAGLSAAGDRTFQALSPALDALAGSQDAADSPLSIGEQLLPVLVAAAPELEAARQDLDAASQARARIDAQTLSPQVAGLLERVDRYLPWIEMALDGTLLAPDLLGAAPSPGSGIEEGSRTYLILAQNNHELRATGGFISGVGELTLKEGRVASLAFGDSYAVDNLEVPHDIPPLAFQQTLFGDLLLFRDTNWDADYPTSAERAVEVYARDRGVQADGVIALDLSGLRLLLEAMGPIQVEGITETLTSDNILEILQAQWANPSTGPSYEGTWDKEWWRHRKDFMGDVANAAMDKLLASGADSGRAGQGVEPAKLVRALKQALDEKHMLIYLSEPGAARLLRGRRWDGALPDWFSSSDMLLVVDSNVGFNKVDPNVDRSIHYQVDLRSAASKAVAAAEGPRASLTLTYHNRSSRQVEACVQEANYGKDYADMMDRCYWDYVRVYVPPSSELLEGPDLPLPAGSLLAQYSGTEPGSTVSTTLTEGGWTAWSTFFDLAPGEGRTLEFDYQLPVWAFDYEPGGLVRYHLQVQKQPGTDAVPLELTILLPPGAELVRTSPADLLPSSDSSLTISTDLRTDREFEVVYRQGKAEP